MTKFDELKNDITSYTLLYEEYLEKYNELVDNDQKKNELEESTTESFYKIDEIKACIQKKKETLVSSKCSDLPIRGIGIFSLQERRLTTWPNGRRPI